jgi:hypothetical protein
MNNPPRAIQLVDKTLSGLVAATLILVVCISPVELYLEWQQAVAQNTRFTLDWGRATTFGLVTGGALAGVTLIVLTYAKKVHWLLHGARLLLVASVLSVMIAVSYEWANAGCNH